MTESSTSDRYELAIVELLGALAYGQMRSFEATARLIALAPDARTADVMAQAAVNEHHAYAQLRDYLAKRTELPSAVMDRQKRHFDAFFDQAPLGDWIEASLFFALGLPIAADFAKEIAPTLDAETAEVVTTALAGRGHFQQMARERLKAELADEGIHERARHLSADLLGRALTSYQGAVADTDALAVLLAKDTGPTESAEGRVKRLAIGVLSGHRRRVVDLGLEDLEDVT